MKISARLWIVVAMMAAALGASAQKMPVVYDSIEAVVKNRPEDFRSLTARFIEADTTLTLPELAIVYYGHAFTPGYNPDEDYADVLEAFDRGDLSVAMTLADEQLRRNPVSLAMLFKLFGMCSVSDQPLIQARIPSLRNRILMLCNLIMETGNGVTNFTPWCVISESDINEFLTKFMQIQREIGRTDQGPEKAVKVKIDGVDEDVILYFDLELARNRR